MDNEEIFGGGERSLQYAFVITSRDGKYKQEKVLF